MSDVNPAPAPAPVRKPVADMTEREMLEEIVVNMRVVNDVIDALADNPMVTAIVDGQNPMLALMGR